MEKKMKLLGIMSEFEDSKCVIEYAVCKVSPRNEAYCVEIEGYYPAVKFTIVKGEKSTIRLKDLPDERKSEEQCLVLTGYKMLTKEEAEHIVELSINNDCIDLTKLGNYRLHKWTKNQTVHIQNDYLWDEEMAIAVRICE